MHIVCHEINPWTKYTWMYSRRIKIHNAQAIFARNFLRFFTAVALSLCACGWRHVAVTLYSKYSSFSFLTNNKNNKSMNLRPYCSISRAAWRMQIKTKITFYYRNFFSTFRFFLFDFMSHRNCNRVWRWLPAVCFKFEDIRNEQIYSIQDSDASCWLVFYTLHIYTIYLPHSFPL